MKKNFVKKLVCPFDKSDLQLTVIKEVGEEILEGIFCCRECERYFPVIFGIPIMSPDEYREVALEKPLLEKWGFQLSEKREFTLSTVPVREIQSM